MIAAAMAAGAPLAAQAKPPRSSLDVRRLETGRFEYRIMDHGKDVAKLVVTIEEQPSGNFHFTGSADGQFLQQWESTTTATLEPISAKLRIGQEARPAALMNLKYDGLRVTGMALVTRLRKSEVTAPERQERAIDAKVPWGTVDQRIDWAAVLAGPMEPGRKFDFAVYDPGAGVSHVVGEVGRIEEVHVPAGTFETYPIVWRVDSATGTEVYQLHATRRLPRILVREKFPDGTQTELVRFEKP
jgi:hypothetical protein